MGEPSACSMASRSSSMPKLSTPSCAKVRPAFAGVKPGISVSSNVVILVVATMPASPVLRKGQATIESRRRGPIYRASSSNAARALNCGQAKGLLRHRPPPVPGARPFLGGVSWPVRRHPQSVPRWGVAPRRRAGAGSFAHDLSWIRAARRSGASVLEFARFQSSIRPASRRGGISAGRGTHFQGPDCLPRPPSTNHAFSARGGSMGVRNTGGVPAARTLVVVDPTTVRADRDERKN
jgi:hypothetical protein